MDKTVSVEGVTQGLEQSVRLALSERVKLIEESVYSGKFPQQRWAHVKITLKNGESYTSAPSEAKGNPENPLSHGEMRKKFKQLASAQLSRERTQELESLTLALETLTPSQIKRWLNLLYQPSQSDSAE